MRLQKTHISNGESADFRDCQSMKNPKKIPNSPFPRERSQSSNDYWSNVSSSNNISSNDISSNVNSSNNFWSNDFSSNVNSSNDVLSKILKIFLKLLLDLENNSEG
ncbi:unnamed protein product [Rotaria magnacalcarata]